jgi:hypothetical protein
MLVYVRLGLCSNKVLTIDCVATLSVESYGATRLGGAQKHKLPFSKQPVGSTKYLCKCTVRPVIYFAPLVQFDKSASRNLSYRIHTDGIALDW